MFRVLASGDIREWAHFPTWQAPPPKPVSQLRVAYSADLGYVSQVDPEIASSVRRAAHRFSELGAVVEEVHPGFSDPRDIFDTLWAAS